MRKVFLLAILVAACAKKEPAPDTTTPAPPPPPPPPPALTAADVNGTWNGTSKAEGDTTTYAFTVAISDSTAKLTLDKTKQSVEYAVKLDADSMVATSKPFNDPSLPKGTPKVIDHTVGRMKDGKMVGVTTLVLASKPDSVVGKGNWEATKAP
ncbi:MAG TPA: hypothetical protein VFW03_27155 [Gemmatimonadaceae bacterium]|nr:hypothetical protein [Gemmatimonadaceae bacterium]